MRGFTLTELIFVLVVVSILLVVGVNYLPKTRALSDAMYVKFKIMQTQSNALGAHFIGENNISCITLTKESLNLREKMGDEKVKYLIKSDIEIVGLNNGNTICFDEFGRVYDGVVDRNLSNLLKNRVVIKIKSDREVNLSIYPITGFIR